MLHKCRHVKLIYNKGIIYFYKWAIKLSKTSVFSGLTKSVNFLSIFYRLVKEFLLWLLHLLLLHLSKQRVKDFVDFFNKIANVTDLSENETLAKVDACSLYTNADHGECTRTQGRSVPSILLRNLYLLQCKIMHPGLEI